jgi:hypothetical protein
VWVADPAEPAPAEPAAPTAEPAVSAVAAPAPAEPPRAAVGPRNAPAPPPHWEEPPTGPGVGAGVLGLGAIVFVGSALSGMVLAIAAWGFGWFGPAVPAEIGAPVPLDPVHVVAATPKDPDPAEKTALEAALKVAAADLALLCKPTGSIPIRVVVEPDGTVRSAAVDPRVLSHQGAACVEKAVSHMDLPRTGTAPVALSVTLTFGR